MPEPDLVARARHSHEALTRGDLEAFLEYIHPDVDFMHVAGAVEGHVYRGHEGVREWWATTREAWTADARIEDIALRPGGLIVSGLMHVRGGHSGVALDQPFAQAIRVVDGLATWWRFFATVAEADAALRKRVEQEGS
jgi:ketosteroid isomerase-like protein